MNLGFDRDYGWPHARLAGIDEAGRGPWAGPVVAAAVILPDDFTLPALNDSKKLSAHKRDVLFAAICAQADYGIGEAQVDEIDRLNILQASFLAMHRALSQLSPKPEIVLIDGHLLPDWADYQPNKTIHALKKGDSLSPAIAAASILAKVTRDRIMVALDAAYPDYHWAANKGYGTAAHKAGLDRAGISPHHRKSFAPIRARLADKPV